MLKSGKQSFIKIPAQFKENRKKTAHAYAHYLWWASIALSSQVQILEKLDCVRLISVLTIQEKIVLVLNDIRSPSPYLARVELT